MNKQKLLIVFLVSIMICAVGCDLFFDRFNLEVEIVGMGTVNIEPLRDKYFKNSVVKLSAIADQGWKFSHWANDAEGENLIIEIMMDQDKDITAVFVREEYALNINLIGEGEVREELLIAPDSYYDFESVVQLTAIPGRGWEFKEYSGDAVGTSPIIQITIDSAKNITATFELLEIPLAIAALLDFSFLEWEERLATDLKPLDWVYEGKILGEEDRLTLFEQMTADEVKIATFNEQGEIIAISLMEADSQDRQEWEVYVTTLLEEAIHHFTLFWDPNDGEEEFSTPLVSTADTILWDSMLSMVSWGEEIDEVELFQCYQKKAGGYNLYWIWGGTRGEISWEVSCSAPPLICEYDVSAYMTLGDAQIQAHLEKTAECCILNYGWGWRTPTGSITINWNAYLAKFEVSVTGLGSSGKGSGSLTVCCPCPSTYRASGHVRSKDMTPLANVEMILTGDEIEESVILTNEEGYWEREDLRGIVTVTPFKEGYYFIPDQEILTVARDDVDFVAYLEIEF